MLKKSIYALLVMALMSVSAVYASSHDAGSLAVFNTPVGEEGPGPAFPGGSYEATVTAHKGDTLHFATMLVQTNDWFLSPNEWGIPLYDENGNPKSGDVTDYVHLFDAGTEIDETPGEGAYQAPRQSGPNSGPADLQGIVRRAHDNSGKTPAINQLIKATLTHNGDGSFTINIENVSGGTSLPGPLAPGVALATSEVAPIFNSGSNDRNLGLEALAEDGNPAILAGNLMGDDMMMSPASDMPAADAAAPAPAAPMADNVVVFAVPTGGEGPAPAFPGEAYEFDFHANKGENLHFATMLVQSNDWFFSPNEWGLPLYDSDGNAKSGDVTNYIHLFDSGTEIDEKPGEGAHQAPRQSGPNSGAADTNPLVRRAHDNYGVTPAVNQLIKATLTYNGDGNFTLSIANVSGGSTLAGPLAPGVAITTSEVAPIFTTGSQDRNQGLEQLAEDGMPGRLADNLR